jgi:hypothetical protein
MSPNVGNFVHDLVEMAKAMEELPQVQAQLADAKAEAETNRLTVQHREESIINLKAQIDELNSKLRAAEDARDAASFRLLEVEEAFDLVSSKAGALLQATGTVSDILHPVRKPEPQPQTEAPVIHHEPMPVDGVGQLQGQSGGDPTANSATTGRVDDAHQSEPVGHSDPLPQASASGTASPSPDAPSQPAEHTQSASGFGGSEGKYAGKRYVNIPHYVSLSEWKAEGGTEENYFH